MSSTSTEFLRNSTEFTVRPVVLIYKFLCRSLFFFLSLKKLLQLLLIPIDQSGKECCVSLSNVFWYSNSISPAAAAADAAYALSQQTSLS